MELLVYAFVFLVVAVFIFVTIERPYSIAAFLVLIYVYRFFNIELPGPLDLRGTLTLILLARLFLFDKKNYLFVKNFMFRDLNGVLIFIFLLISCFVTFSYYGDIKGQVFLLIQLIISLILGYIIVNNEEGQKAFFRGVVLAGILCTIDLIFSAITYGSLRTRSLIKVLILGDHTDWNHNALGLVCALALIMVLIFFVKKRIAKKSSFILMLILTLGLFLSTSRSALMAVIFVSLIFVLVQKEVKIDLNKVFISLFGLVIFFVSFYFIYHALLSSGKIKSELVDQAYYRLYGEPMSIFGSNESQVFNEYGVKKEGNTKWRLGRALSDLSKYSEMDLGIKLFGLGNMGYIYNDIGGDNHFPHNGYVLLLIERGIVGFTIFIFVIFSLSYRSFKLIRQNLISTPIIYLLLILAFYVIGQNSELTNYIAFLIIGAAIGNTKEGLLLNKAQDIELTSPDLSLKKMYH
jgi:hypothetical protein